MAAQRDIAWVGIDVGKTHHWACVVDAEGKTLLSVKVANDEAEIMALLANTGSLAMQLIWAVDIIGAPSALLLALLARAGQSARYASGRVVAAMSAAYGGEGKTDAKDAYVIAETARLRRDLAVIDAGTDLVRKLAVLTGHREDLIADRVRMINRLRDLMTSVFPSLERAFDYSSHKGALVLLTGYATPDRIRRIGQTRLTGWLQNRRVRGSADVAARAITAAKAQTVVLPGQDLTATIITELANSILALDDRLKALDAQIEMTLAEHPHATIIQSMPGFGPILGASLLVSANDLRAFPSAGHLAAAAGLVPVPNDSGRRTGNLHRPLRYSRPLRHVFYLSAQTSMMRAGPTATTTSRNVPKAPPTPRPSSPWPAAASTSYGHCYARTEHGPQHRPRSLKRLDNTIEIPSGQQCCDRSRQMVGRRSSGRRHRIVNGGEGSAGLVCAGCVLCATGGSSPA